MAHSPRALTQGRHSAADAGHVHLHARLISHEDVQVSIAPESGLDIGAFLARLHDGSAAKAFAGDRALMASLGVRGSPTFLVKFDDARYMLRGFNGYETFVAVIDSATQGALKPAAVEATEYS